MGRLTPLSRWLVSHPEQVVAVSRGLPISALEFESKVKAWTSTLNKRPGTRWAVFHRDASEFLAILFSLWQLDKLACVPGDNLPHNSHQLESHVDGFIGQFPGQDSISKPEDSDFDSVIFKSLSPDFSGLEVYTSGSTGRPIAILKTIGQLEAEVDALENLWPTTSNAIVLSTVSHQHMYGLTFRLFWPISSARSFEVEAIEYTEDIYYLAKQYQVFNLVSSPAHLSRMNTSIDWSDIQSRCQFILSSTAPLQKHHSLEVKNLLRTPVREIYGSSETGAIAWREQSESSDDALWNPLPGISYISQQGSLVKVNAPHLTEIDGFVLSDKVELLPSGQFKLLGRVDRIVKIEGKRVSLATMENLLTGHHWIKNAKALTIERRRVETAMVIELSEQGQDEIQASSQKKLTNTLRSLLSDHFENVVLPRRWRIVKTMPYNQQGKIPMNDLQKLFDKETVKWPEIIRHEKSADGVTLNCFIPSDLIYFDGHFPQQAILPGVTQIHWAEALGRKYFALDSIFNHLEAIKFQQVIMPEAEVTLMLQYNPDKKKLGFKYSSDRGVHSSGRICFQ